MTSIGLISPYVRNFAATAPSHAKEPAASANGVSAAPTSLETAQIAGSMLGSLLSVQEVSTDAGKAVQCASPDMVEGAFRALEKARLGNSFDDPLLAARNDAVPSREE